MLKEFFRNIFGIRTLHQKVRDCINLVEEEQLLKTEIDNLADLNYEKMRDYHINIKDPSNKDMIDVIVSKHEEFLKSHIKNVAIAKEKYNKIKVKRGTLLNDPDISKAYTQYQKCEAYNTLKKAYKGRKIKRCDYDNIMKSEYEGKVHYSDMLVWCEGKLLMLQRSSLDDFAPNKFSLPGGHVDPGEEPESAAKRELMEETGIEVDTCEKVGEYEDDDVKICYYQVYLQDQPEVILESSEHQGYKWVTIEELEQLDTIKNLKDNLTKIFKPHITNEVIKIKKALENGLLDYDEFEKAGGHKYIHREGVKGNYKYIYAEPHGTDGGYEDNKENLITVEDHKKALEKFFKVNNIEYSFIGYSDTNGISIYYDIDGKKHRFSNHSVINIERMKNEIHHPLLQEKTIGLGGVIKTKNNKERILNYFKKSQAISTILKAYIDNQLDEDVLTKALKGQDKVAYVMGEFKAGRLKGRDGKVITSRKQALAIAMSEAGLSKSEEEREEDGESDEDKALETVEKAFKDGLISEDILLKARSGVYADNAVNRKLKRVGQKYGSSGKKEESNQKSKSTEQGNESKQSDKPLEDHAKEASEAALKNTIANSPNEEERTAANNELARREKEEKPQEEEKTEKESKEIKTSKGEDKEKLGVEELREKKNELIKKFDKLSKEHKKKYGNIDISQPKSEEEKKSEKELSDLASEMNKMVVEINKLVKNSIKKSEQETIKKDYTQWL